MNPETHKVTTSSLKVAEVFGKSHKNVLRDIEALDCSEEFGRLNFERTSYKDFWNREKTCYEMTKDGFTFLAMGYTGKKASEFKEKYIQAFNELERRDMERQVQAPQLSRIELLQMALEAEQKLIEAQPKVEAYDAFIDSETLYSLENAGKCFGMNKLTFPELLKPKNFNNWYHFNL